MTGSRISSLGLGRRWRPCGANRDVRTQRESRGDIASRRLAEFLVDVLPTIAMSSSVSFEADLATASADANPRVFSSPRTPNDVAQLDELLGGDHRTKSQRKVIAAGLLGPSVQIAAGRRDRRMPQGITHGREVSAAVPSPSRNARHATRARRVR